MQRNMFLSGRLRKEIIDKHITGEKVIFKPLHVLVTTAANIIKKYYVHGTVARLSGHGCKRNCCSGLISRSLWIESQEKHPTQGQETSLSDHTICCLLNNIVFHRKRP